MFFEKRNVETNQVLFWKNFWYQNQPEEWPMTRLQLQGCPCYCQNKISMFTYYVSSEGDVMLPHFFKKGETINMFWSKKFWLPNSPYLNPLDYYIWSVVEKITNKSRHLNVTSLRTAIENRIRWYGQHYITMCVRTLRE